VSSALQERIKQQTVQILNYDWHGNLINRGAGVFVSVSGVIVTAMDVLDGGSCTEVITADGSSHFVDNIVSVDRESGLVMLQLDAIPGSFQYVEKLSAIPAQGEKIVIAGIGSDGNIRIVDSNVTDLGIVPVYSYFRHIGMPQPLFETGCPIFNSQGELAGIAVARDEGDRKAAIVVSGRKVLSLTRDRENTRPHSQWIERGQDLWSESPTGTFLKGLASYRVNNYDRACPLLENAIANGKGLSEEAFYILGNCYESEDLHGSAIKAYTNALKFNPSSGMVYENLAWSSMKAGEPGDALEACYKAVIYGKGCKSRSYLLMAKIRNSIGDFRAAVTAAHGALNYDPDCASAYNEMGVAYNGLGMYGKAVAALEIATSLDPLYGEAFNNLGQAYLRSGRVFNAIIVLKYSAAVRTEYSAALKNLGEAYSSAGLHGKAREAYTTAIGMCPDDPFTFSRLAAEYVKADDFQEAATVYQYGIKYNPDSGWLHYKLGRIYCRTGRMAAARSEHYLLNQLNPNLAGQLLIWIERESNS